MFSVVTRFVSRIFSVAVIALLTSSLLEAQTREWVLENPAPQPTCPTFPSPNCIWYGQGPLSNPSLQLQPNALIKRLATRYNSDTRVWEFDLIVSDNPNVDGLSVPTSFWMVMNHGPMPYQLGMASIIYFDATNPAQPNLTVYGYNNGHELFDRSWEDGNRQMAGVQAPDTICTSRVTGSCAGWVQQLAATQNPSTNEHRFQFIVDATEILNHAPIYSSGGALWHSPAAGAEPRIFGSFVGIWLHLGASRSYSYSPDGYISSVDEGADKEFDPVALYYDREYIPTNLPPVCGSNLEISTLRPGQSVSWTVEAYDEDDGIVSISSSGPIECTDLLIDEHNAQRQCTYTAPSGPNAGGTSVTEVSTFTDKSGATVSCTDTITVVNTPPTCEITTNGSSPFQCEGTTTTVPLSIMTNDADQDPVAPTYTISCTAGAGTVTTTGGVVASVTGPGLGLATSCDLTVTVSDGFDTGSCGTSFSVNPCQLDCLGTPLGTAMLDQCGVCNGNSGCFDCFDVPFGTATVDRCGVCGGDGSSCLGCSDVNTTSALLALDGSAHAARVRVDRALNLLRRLEKFSPSGKKFARLTRRAATAAYIEAWQRTWEFPLSVTNCTNTQFCTTVTTTGSSTEIQKSFDTLAELHRSIVQRVARRSKKRASALSAAFEVARQMFDMSLASAPTTASSCTGTGS